MDSQEPRTPLAWTSLCLSLIHVGYMGLTVRPVPLTRSCRQERMRNDFEVEERGTPWIGLEF